MHSSCGGGSPRSSERSSQPQVFTLDRSDMEGSMKEYTLSILCAATVLALGATARPAEASRSDDNNLVVTVMFGAGMNTANPASNPANHHVMPQTVHVRTGGVVNFVVAGFHQIFVYNPGMRLDNVIVPPSGTFVNDLFNLYYTGILPAGGSGNIPATVNPSNAQNRVEPVSFSEPGTYLVICNVRGHLLNGMYAYVIVGGDEDNASHHDH
jgi:plastocyanin